MIRSLNHMSSESFVIHFFLQKHLTTRKTTKKREIYSDPDLGYFGQPSLVILP